MKRVSFAFGAVAVVLAFLLSSSLAGASPTPTAGSNVPVTDQAYVSADVMGGTGSYSDGVLTRCGTDNRMQNEPTLAIDPRDTKFDCWPLSLPATLMRSIWTPPRPTARR